MNTLSDIDLAIALSEIHDDLLDILERFDAGVLVSRQAGADLLEQLQAISDFLFNREQ